MMDEESCQLCFGQEQSLLYLMFLFFFFQAEDGIRDLTVTGVQTCALPISVLDGRSGVRRISRFDASEISVQIAGEVADFDELAWVDRRERKHVSRVLPLAIAAATEALGVAGIDAASLPLAQKRRFGGIIGSGGGSPAVHGGQ